MAFGKRKGRCELGRRIRLRDVVTERKDVDRVCV